MKVTEESKRTLEIIVVLTFKKRIPQNMLKSTLLSNTFKLTVTVLSMEVPCVFSTLGM